MWISKSKLPKSRKMLPVNTGYTLLLQSALSKDAESLSIQRHISRTQKSALELALLGPLSFHLAQFFHVFLLAPSLLAQAFVDHGDQLPRLGYLVRQCLLDFKVSCATTFNQV